MRFQSSECQTSPRDETRRDMTSLVVNTFALLIVPSFGRAQDVFAWGTKVIVGALCRVKIARRRLKFAYMRLGC